MFANIDYALANARVTELHDHVHGAHAGRHGSLADRMRRRRDAARRARSRRAPHPRLRAA